MAIEAKTVTSVQSKELSRELLCEGYTSKVDCANYWDAHGQKIKCASTQHKFDCQKKFEIFKVIAETTYSTINRVYTSEWWYLYINGEKLDIGDIMSYKVLKSKLKLDCCIGAG